MSASSSGSSPQASFEAFSWHHHPQHTSAETLAEHSKDIGSGIATLLQLIEASDLRAEDDLPLLTPLRRGELLRLAISSAQQLADLATREIEQRNLQPATT